MGKRLELYTVKEIEDFIWIKGNRDILLRLGDEEKTISQIAELVDMTYCHVHKSLSDFKALGLVTMKKEGRKMKVKLTEFGKDIQSRIALISAKLSSKFE